MRARLSSHMAISSSSDLDRAYCIRLSRERRAQCRRGAVLAPTLALPDPRRSARPAGAVFLDKDGTVLSDVPYNVLPQRMRFAPRGAAALRRLANSGQPLFVVSNQSGVARGAFAVSALLPMARQLEKMFAQSAATLAEFAFCPFHPQGSRAVFARDSSFRKPAPGMIIDVASRHEISLSKSWMIGDILDDIEAGARAGCRTILIDNGNETEWIAGAYRQPTALARNILVAAHIIAAAKRAPQRRFRLPEVVRL